MSLVLAAALVLWASEPAAIEPTGPGSPYRAPAPTTGQAASTEPALPAPETIHFTSADGVRLEGTLWRANAPGPAVLILQACDGKGRQSAAPLAARLQREGLHVLAFDYRGEGGSGGDPFPGKMPLADSIEWWRTRWAGDLEAALEFLTVQPGVDDVRIGAAGSSCGTYLALQLAQHHPDAVHALVLVSGPTGPEAESFVALNPKLAVLGATRQSEVPASEWISRVVEHSPNPRSRLVLDDSAGHGSSGMTPLSSDLIAQVATWMAESLREAD